LPVNGKAEDVHQGATGDDQGKYMTNEYVLYASHLAAA
jgi:hypothetical protein